MSPSAIPPLPDDFEPTRATLHAYAQAPGAIARAHGIAHPKWWHISLNVRPDGLVTDPMPLPGGGALQIRLDLNTHQAVVEASTGASTAVPLDVGLTGTEFGDRLVAAVAEFGLGDRVDRDRYANDEDRSYDPEAASTFFAAAIAAATLLERHRATLPPEAVGPVQLWPHGFDLAFEWFGTRMEEHGGEAAPSQINFGFYPGGDAYFYANPWPFEEDALLGHELPGGANWHTEGWEGTMLSYADAREVDDAEQGLLDYFATVHSLAAPTLTA
jgi:hypothetical protein